MDAQAIKAAFTKKIGPLPAWGWGVLIGGAYLAYNYTHPDSPSYNAATTADAGAQLTPTEGAFDAGAGLASGAAQNLDPAGGYTPDDFAAAFAPYLVGSSDPAPSTGDGAASKPAGGSHKALPKAGTRVTSIKGEVGKVVYAHGNEYHVYGSGKNKHKTLVKKNVYHESTPVKNSAGGSKKKTSSSKKKKAKH